MGKFFNYTNSFLIFLTLLGIFYLYNISVDIKGITHSSKNANNFSFIIKSKIDQEIKLHIATGKYKLISVTCNDSQINFPKKKMQWFEGVGEQAILKIKEGQNNCTVNTNNYNKVFTPIVKRKITFLNYGVLFVLLGIPIFHLIFSIFIFLFDKIKFSKSINNTDNLKKSSKKTYLLFSILALGVLIRIIYFHKFGVTLFQHDWHGHIEFIKYLADTWTLPLPSKGLEYPQQPLYYLISAGIYSFLSNFALTEKELIFGVGYISLISSIVFLYYGYRFVSLLTQSVWVQTISIIFISLTPSLVYLSARINNDSLVMALSAFVLYNIVKSYQSGFTTNFHLALFGVSLIFITKISAASLELLFFTLLLTVYMRTDNKELIKKRLYLFGIVGIFLLGFTLLRVYLPVENTFHMVNSSANYPNQMIKDLGMSYFASFHFDSLLSLGYSHVYGLDAIRYSFITYQFGTMFFGEFDYTYFFNRHDSLQFFMQFTLLFGLIYVLGFITYIVNIHKTILIEKLLFATLLLNLILILKFMLTYPAVCNTDFRYFVPSFIIFAFVFAKGLSNFKNIRYLGKVINLFIALLVVSEILYFTVLLS